MLLVKIPSLGFSEYLGPCTGHPSLLVSDASFYGKRELHLVHVSAQSVAGQGYQSLPMSLLASGPIRRVLGTRSAEAACSTVMEPMQHMLTYVPATDLRARQDGLPEPSTGNDTSAMSRTAQEVVGNRVSVCSATSGRSLACLRPGAQNL